MGHPRYATFACMTLVFAPLSPAWAQPWHAGIAADKDDPRYALLIGVEKYKFAPELRYTGDDVQKLAASLRTRGGYWATEIYDQESKPQVAEEEPLFRSEGEPTGEVIRSQLTGWLRQRKSADTALVYFSGHGFRDREGKLYLAPIDCDPANPEATGIPVHWLRDQLAECKAKVKLLVIDACHAGSDKGGRKVESVAAKDLGMEFRSASGVMTMASSQGTEKSLLWEEKKQSLFSYWLNQGLKGHADRDGDGGVTFDELYEYVHDNVVEVAKRRFDGRAQTPARIVPGDAPPGVLTLIRPKPRTLREVLDDTAEELATAMELRVLKRVGVLEFTNDTRVGELLGANYGFLGRYCTEEIERRLVRKCGDRFDVVDRRMLREALAKSQFTVRDLATERLRGLAGEVPSGMPAVVLGTLRDRSGRIVTVRAELQRTEDHKLILPSGGTAVLNDSEWAMLGRSPSDALPGVMDNIIAPPNGPNNDGRQRPPPERLVDELDRLSQNNHPLANPEFPYRVQIRVGGVQRRGKILGNDMFVALNQGEVYEIAVKNSARRAVMMRLLVDGLNTLPDRSWDKRDADADKGMMVEWRQPGERREPLYGMQRVNLDEARAWKVDPRRWYVVPGFFTGTGQQGAYHEFRVVDAQESLAARQQFTDQVGMITAAFYEAQEVRAAAEPKSSGTGAGRWIRRQTEEYDNVMVGDLLAVVHIRYVSPEVLAAKAGQATDQPLEQSVTGRQQGTPDSGDRIQPSRNFGRSVGSASPDDSPRPKPGRGPRRRR